MEYEWTAPSGVVVRSCRKNEDVGGFWSHWKHYALMVAALSGCKWAYRP